MQQRSARRHSALTRMAAGAMMVAIAVSSAPAALAQTAAAQQPREFDIPADRLSSAAVTFSAQSGVRVRITAAEAGDVQVNALRGRFAANEAFERLVAAKGLSWHWGTDGAIVVSGVVVSAESSDRTLGAVRIEGAQTAGVGGGIPLDGFGRGAGANGSTDVTATEGTDSLTTQGTSIVTKQPRRFNETPQSVSSVTQAQIEQQALTNVTSALNSVPGITLQIGSGGSTTFISRGFSVNNYVIDGGASLNYPGGATGGIGAGGGQGIAFAGTPDLSQYDHVEVLKGSNALFSGASSPGGTIGLRRKRPLDRFQLIVSGHYGSWNDARGDLDISIPLTESGHTRFRGTLAYQNQDFFYDITHSEMVHAYGVLEQDLGPNTVLRFGGSYERRDIRAPNLNGVPLRFDGGDLNLPRDTIFSAPWSTADGRDNEQFLQVDHQLDPDWKLAFSGTRLSFRTDGFAPDFQGLGITPAGNNFGYVRDYVASSDTEQYSLDANLNGKFTLFDLDQTLVFGADYRRSKQNYITYSITRTNTYNVYSFDPRTLAEPARPTIDTSQSTLGSNGTTREHGVYANLGLQPVKGLHVNLGLRYSNYRIDSQLLQRTRIGSFRRESLTRSQLVYDSNFIPSASIVYEFNPQVSIYASYADTFEPAGIFITTTGELLPPKRGRTYEAGVKYTAPGEKLHASVSVFDVVQRNVPLQVSFGVTPIGSCCFANGAAVKNQGVEVTVAGEITPNLQINGGYTYLDVNYNEVYQQFITGNALGTPISLTQQPRHQAKLWGSYRLPGSLEAIQISVGGRVESDRLSIGSSCAALVNNVCTGVTPYRFTQSTYAVLDASIAYRLTQNVEARVSVTNITDTRYYATVSTANRGNFYGEPRKVLASVSAKF